ncbi:hypothetical protein QQP08_009839 [Theobroma cacao]|nr:hypothetical protein QQP08_009839 [Theobroma cacao]
MECIWGIKGWMTLQATETHNKRSMSPLSLVRRLRETSNKCCSFTPETGRRSDQISAYRLVSVAPNRFSVRLTASLRQSCVKNGMTLRPWRSPYSNNCSSSSFNANQFAPTPLSIFFILFSSFFSVFRV